MNRMSYFLAAATLVLIGTSNATATPFALGFGWDTNAGLETVYQIDLATGETSIGDTIPNLKSVVVGGHDVDFPTSTAVILSASGGSSVDTLYVVIPSTKLVYSFKIPEIGSKGTFSRALLRPTDGAIFLVGNDGNTPLNSLTVYQVTLNATSAKAGITAVGSFVTSGTSLDTVKIGSDGKIYILTADSPTQFVVFDTTSGASTQFALESVTPSALFVCDGITAAVPRIFMLHTDSRSRDVLSQTLSELSSVGQITNLFAATEISSFLSGTSSCHNNTLRIISLSGNREAEVATLYSHALGQGTSFSSQVLDRINIKILHEVSSAFLRSTATEIKSKSAYKIVSSQNLKRCAAQKGEKKNPLKNAKGYTFRKMAQSLKKVRISSGVCTFKSAKD